MSRVYPLLKPNHLLDASLAFASVVYGVLVAQEPLSGVRKRTRLWTSRTLPDERIIYTDSLEAHCAVVRVSERLYLCLFRPQAVSIQRAF